METIGAFAPSDFIFLSFLIIISINKKSVSKLFSDYKKLHHLLMILENCPLWFLCLVRHCIERYNDYKAVIKRCITLKNGYKI